MRYLIDGHNLIGQMRDISLDDPNDEEKLIRRLRPFAHGKKRSLIVVFDPGGVSSLFKPPSSPDLRVLYAKPGSTADAVILQLVRKNRTPRGLTVVTSDRSLAEKARAEGVEVLPAEEFIRLILPMPDSHSPDDPAEKPEYQPTRDEVERWLSEFESRSEETDRN